MNNTYGIPLAIIASGILIAGVLIATNSNGGGGANSAATGGREQNTAQFRLPDETDHVRGNPDASVAVVEFSDFECPFCARLHPTMKRIIEENNDIKWVYRHFPLSTIHSRALSAAVASECIARLGNNDNFWTFADRAFQNQKKLGDAWYRSQAASFGIDAAAFDSCTKDRSLISHIQTDLSEATATGGRGTPYVVVVTASGQLSPFSGALPYGQLSALLQQARNN